MKLYLLGYPLDHSVSPAFQNAALRAAGLADWTYELLPEPAQHLPALVEMLRSNGCAGANVTIPHKKAVVPLLDSLTETARAIGAINTVLHRDGRLTGDNTDGAGLMCALAENGFDPLGTRCAILGAGGAAAASAYALATEGAQEVSILNRTAARAEELCTHLSSVAPARFTANDWSGLPASDLVVNATSVGMYPHVDESPLPEATRLKQGALAFDLVYNPVDTQFLREAAALGAVPVSGLEMLIWQGALAFQLWTGRPAPLAAMREAARQALGAGKG